MDMGEIFDKLPNKVELEEVEPGSGFFGKYIEGYSDDITLLNWYLEELVILLELYFIYLDFLKKYFLENLTILVHHIKYFMF